MSRVKIALYKGPKREAPMEEHLFHWAVVIRSLQKYQHCELVIDEICYSSSAIDGGVRRKYIPLDSEQWDIIDLPNVDIDLALERFKECEGFGYDWNGVLRFIIPFIKQKPDHMFCSELCAYMLDIPGGDSLFPGDFKYIEEMLDDKYMKQLS